jgi:hypothetical protein
MHRLVTPKICTNCMLHPIDTSSTAGRHYCTDQAIRAPAKCTHHSTHTQDSVIQPLTTCTPRPNCLWVPTPTSDAMC